MKDICRILKTCVKNALRPLFLSENKGWKKTIHLSIDDVQYSLRDLTEQADAYTSIYEHPFFAMLKRWHERYGARFTLYVYGRASGIGQAGGDWDIRRVTRKFDDEFQEADFCFFGYHGISVDTFPCQAKEDWIRQYEDIWDILEKWGGYIHFDCTDFGEIGE